MNSAFGSADDLVALSDALHERGMVCPKDVPRVSTLLTEVQVSYARCRD